MAADARQTNPLAAAAPARLEALFLDAPEVECSKGKASAPYEFGVKASITTTNARAPRRSVRPARYRDGQSNDGQTLGGVIPATEAHRPLHRARSRRKLIEQRLGLF
jgi:hypothetical protein